MKTVVLELTRESQAPQDNIAGHASILRQMCLSPIYDAGKFGPNSIIALPQDQQVIWVRVNSVSGKGTKVVLTANVAELFAIWDYEEKYESKGWDSNDQQAILSQRLHSPPTKCLGFLP